MKAASASIPGGYPASRCRTARRLPACRGSAQPHPLRLTHSRRPARRRSAEARDPGRIGSDAWRSRSTSPAIPRPTRSSATSPLALLIGFVLDQQVTVQKAFSSPLELSKRLGGLDAREIAAIDPEKLEEVFREKPALHRFPANMARRTQELCAVIVERLRRRRGSGLDGRPRRRRPRAAPAGPARHRRDEGSDDGRRDREAPRRPPCRLGGVRTDVAQPRRRRLAARRSSSTRPRSAPTRPPSGHSRPPDDADRAADADRRGPDARRDRPRAGDVHRGGTHEPRHRRLRRALRDRCGRPRPRDAPRSAPARGRDPPRLQRRPPRADPGAAAAADEAGGDRGAPRADAGDRRSSRPDAPQVRRPRRHGRLVGLDELDGRLVEPAGERDRPGPRRTRARPGLHAQPRRAVGERHGRAHGPGAAAAGRRRRRDRGAALVHAGVRRRALPSGGEVPRPGQAPHPDRVAGADLRADPRHAGRGRERATVATSPG